ncbi:UPF0688 protein C1orf174 homolog [Brachyhypopomus gauderio]|uniref:UPF0688 protein C1orf174 homolog n=1 Tax=Brachyhypopomus gauderio TaxID=698409 RepID=UPI0040438D12
MAGERTRLPKRPLHGDETPPEDVHETVGTQQGSPAYADRCGGKVRRGKENNAVKWKALQHSDTADPAGKVDVPVVYGSAEPTDHSIFFDEDSNQIFPVEQFFGNLDAVQDYSGKATTTERASRREHRRRHYYAKEDPGEEQT